jgi:hypothetical protein
MEAANSTQPKSPETGELLTAIVEELKSIGLILARQNERIEALSRIKEPTQTKDWDSVSVAVGSAYPKYSLMLMSSL